MKLRPALAVLALTLATTSGCTLAGESGESDRTSEATGTGGADGEQIKDVVLVTHDSFALPKKVIKGWEAETGYHLVIRQSGDAGSLTNKLVLTKESPTGDLAFGVDNTFAGRAVSEGVFAPYDVELPAGAEEYALDGDGGEVLAPVDTGNVCVNIDTTWFAANDVPPPATLDDLTKPAYDDLFVVPGAPTSSPGFAFLLATIAAHGGAESDAWQDYWTDLMANDTKLTKGWEDAYFVDFTAGSDGGVRPIVVSYDSSPAFTVDKQTGRSTTKALLDTCFRQVEYAGVLDGADNPEGAQAALELLLSQDVQAALPTSMYVFPVRDDVKLPADWAKFAEQPTETLEIAPEDIDAHRDEWLTEWTDLTTR